MKYFKLIIFIIGISGSVISQTKETEYILFSKPEGKNKQYYLPEIMINFNSFNYLPKKKEFIYLKLNNGLSQESKNSIFWDIKILQPNSIFKKRIKWEKKEIRTINVPIPKSVNIYTDMRGSALVNIDREIIIEEKSNYLKFEILDNLNDDQNLFIKNLPIIAKSVDENGLVDDNGWNAKLEIGFGDEFNVKWFDSNYEIIISEPEIKLENDLIIQNNEISSIINLHIKVGAPSVINKNNKLTLSSKNNLFQFDEMKIDKIFVTNNNNIIEGNLIIENNNILWYPINELKSNSEITFNDITLKNYKSGVDNFYLSVDYYTGKKDNKNKNPKIFQDKNYDIIIFEPTLELPKELPENELRLLINNDENYIPLPHLTFGIKKDKSNIKVYSDLLNKFSKIYKKDSKIKITIPNQNQIYWDKIETDLNPWIKKSDEKKSKYLITKKENNKSIEILFKKSIEKYLDEKSRRNALKITDLGLKIENENRNYSSDLYFNYNRFINPSNIKFNHKLNLGIPLIGLESNQIIMTADTIPVINDFIIQEKQFSVLYPGDIITYELNQNIKFDKKRIKSISHDKKFKIEIKSNSTKGSNYIAITILDNLIPEKKYVFNNIPIKKIDIPLKAFHGKINIKSNIKSLENIRNTPIYLDNKTIEVIDIKCELSSSVEYIKNINNENQKFELPKIEIINNSLTDALKKGDLLSLTINNIGISIFNKDITVISNNNKEIDVFDMNSLKIDANTLNLKLNRKLIPNEKIEIGGFEVMFNPEKYSVNKHINMSINSNNKLKINSKNTITFASVEFVSSKEQLLIKNQSNIQLYEIFLDFSKVNHLANNLKTLIIKIPEEVDIEWGNSNLSFNGNFHSFYKIKKTEIKKKSVQIHLEQNQFKKIENPILQIINLKLKRIREFDLKEFKLSLSIENNLGEIFDCALDANKKRISGKKNAVEIYNSKIEAGWFPFQKGKYIDLIIPNDSDAEWDLDNSKLELKKTKNGRVKGDVEDPEMIKIDRIKSNKNVLSLRIEKDLTERNKLQVMDFGKKYIADGLIIKKNNSQINEQNIDVNINSIYGYHKINEKSKPVKVNMHLNGNNLTLNLEIEKEDELDYQTIEWFRNPKKIMVYFDLINDYSSQSDGDIQIENEDVENAFKAIKKQLEKYYNISKDGKYIKYDWTFWYYLSMYKKLADDLKTVVDTDSLKCTGCKFDLSMTAEHDAERSEQLGYKEWYRGINFPPVEGGGLEIWYSEKLNECLDYVQDCEIKECEEIILNDFVLPIFADGLPDLSSKLKIQFRVLLYGITKYVYNDIEIHEDIGNSYPGYQYYIAENEINSKNRVDIRENIPAYYEFLENEYNYPEELREKFDSCNMQRSLGVKVKDEGISNSNNQIGFQFMWQAPKTSELEEWKMTFLEYEDRLKQNSKRYSIDFESEFQLQGAKEYHIDFHPIKENKIRFSSVILSSIILLSWIAF